jgi:hypothetical protein
MRRGQTSLVVVMLLAGILLAITVLIGVLLTQRGGSGPETSGVAGSPATSTVADGQVVPRREVADPPKSPEPIQDTGRIKETLQTGKTYRVVLKMGLNAKAEDKAWALKEVINLAYVAEMQIDRTIESNDGKRVVELRHFVTSRNVKLLCKVEEVTIDLGLPGTLLLGALDYIRPGTAATVVAAQPIVDAFLRSVAQQPAESEATKAVAHVDTLSGKTVRITYGDGVGVESVQPVGCTLSPDERDFLFATAVLSDCYIWDLKAAPGERWTVDGAQFSGFIDPSLRGQTTGEIHLVRDADSQMAGRPVATLRIEGGTLMLDRSDVSTRRIGSFAPEGSLWFNQADKIVERAQLTGRFVVEEVSTDHILFETSFRTRPVLNIEYACSIR